MKEIISFSNHCLEKIEILKIHGFNVSKEMVSDIVMFPDKTEKGYKERLIAQRSIDDFHVIRVVYEIRGDEFYVITVYPGRRERYEKDQV